VFFCATSLFGGDYIKAEVPEAGVMMYDSIGLVWKTISATNPIPVTVASFPLPTGAATAAKQLADGHNVTVDNASGASAVNIQDGGNSITVDGAFFQTTQPVSIAVTASTITSSHLVLTSINTEYSKEFTNAKQISIQCRGSSSLKFSGSSGVVAAGEAYSTIKSGGSENWKDINFTGTLYFACSELAGETIEFRVVTE